MKISKHTLKISKSDSNGICRIVQLSDLHKKVFGKNNIKLINTVKALNPDLIFITGDMVSRNVSELITFQHLIDELLKNSPVYYCLGNHEQDLEYENNELYKIIIKYLSESDVHLLDNTTEAVTVNGISMKISGLTLFRRCYKNNGGYKNLHKITSDEITKLIGKRSDGFNILLAHNPMFFDAYSEYGSDLIFSGHVHGGCVRLPVIGGILSPERKFFPKYTSGIYRKNNSSMLVSCGLGKLRFFNPPEIVVVEICNDK